MPVTTPKRINFSDDTYEWLMSLTRPIDMATNATLQEFSRNEERREINKKIEFMRNKQ